MTTLTKPLRSTSEMSVLIGLLASSRPLQATLSIAQPLIAAMLAFGGILPLDSFLVLAIGSLTGMFAVFALNDYLDYSLDRKDSQRKLKAEWDIDSALTLHPYAQGMITKTQQLIWIGVNTLITIFILHRFSDWALGLFFLVIILEAIYCTLATKTKWKGILAGLIVSFGGFIGWFAAGGDLNYSLLACIGIVYFCWEIGGRNIPNDMADHSPDRQKGIRTIATQHGMERSSQLVFGFSIITILANIVLGIMTHLGTEYIALTSLAGVYLLVLPGFKLIQQPTSPGALNYFNKASLYPVALFIGIILAYWMTRI